MAARRKQSGGDMMNWGLFGFLVGQMHGRRREENGGVRREGPPKEKHPNQAGGIALVGIGLIVLLFWLFE